MTLNPPKKLSEHFTYAEAVYTHICVANEPDEMILRNMLYVAEKMEFVRAILGSPIQVNSWYRSTAVNSAVRGASGSDHLVGCAVDFLCVGYGSPLQVCQKLIQHQDTIGYKQLILEHTWTHISWDPIPNSVPRLQVLSLLNGGTYAVGLTDSTGKYYS